MWTIVMTVGFISLALALIVGLAFRKEFNKYLPATLIALVTFSVGIAFASYPIALGASQKGAVSGYHQFLNGSIVSTGTYTFHCTEDGPCAHTWSCDPYQVATGTDKNGNTTYMTLYHDCPRADEEYSYFVVASVGFKTFKVYIADHIYGLHPKKWRWDIPMDGNVPRGVPAEWLKLKADLAAGNSDPITATGEYDNYILPSEADNLKASSSDIKLLQAKKLLPEPTLNYKNPIHDQFKADKVMFVGPRPANYNAWQDTLMHFNAALGMKKQGDMHIVVIPDSKLRGVVSPDAYIDAVKAYWQNKLGRYALAKNGIVLVLGTSDTGTTVQWARALTGMPIGNGEMTEALKNNLAGVAFDPTTVIGHTTASVAGAEQVTYHFGNGIVEQTVMQEFPFKRACMKCKSKGDSGAGFVYLKTTLPISTGNTVGAIMIVGVISLIVWIIALGLSLKDITEEPDPRNFPYRSMVRSIR